tara:strand:+ start:8392 stop:9228 length:837 start_codon:yes stop_codon:yes gene_type:complete
MKLITKLIAIIIIILIISIIITTKYTVFVPKSLWKMWYNYISKFNIETMNYGYSDLTNKPIEIDNINHFSINLYDKVANLNNLILNNGDTILEIGCGRGGGLFHLARKHPNYNFVGLDYSENAIKMARNKFKLPNLKFDVGDALSLPYRNNSFSVVLNVESSHCYFDFKKFILEVKRVLKPNGYFCYTDFRKNCMKEIADNFDIIFAYNITPNVLNSLDNLYLYRKKQILNIIKHGNFFDKFMQYLLADEFAGGPNSKIYLSLKNKNSEYLHIQAINK